MKKNGHNLWFNIEENQHPCSSHPDLFQKKELLTFDGLTQAVKKTFIQFLDSRKGKNTKYRVEDAALSALAVFFMQSPSFWDYQKTMVQSQGRSNAQTLFGVHDIPCDNQIRKRLNSVTPETVVPLFWNRVDAWQERAWLDNLRSIGGTWLVPFEGTPYCSSQKIHCEHGSTRQHQRKTTYFHQVVTFEGLFFEGVSGMFAFPISSSCVQFTNLLI